MTLRIWHSVILYCWRGLFNQFFVYFIICLSLITSDALHADDGTSESTSKVDANSELGYYTIGPFKYNSAYPGICPSGAVYDIGMSKVTTGVYSYYTVYGTWPLTWSSVVKEGLVQVPIEGFLGEIIDPDDDSLDFLGDISYEPSEDEQHAIIRQLRNLDDQNISIHELDGITTIEQLLSGIAATWPDGSTDKYMGNIKWYKFFAIRSSLCTSISTFKSIHGMVPLSMEELLISGLAVIDCNSVNPLTDDHFYFDGRGSNYYYVYQDEQHSMLLYKDSDGSDPVHSFMN